MEKEERKQKRLQEAELAFERYKEEKIQIIENKLKLRGINKAKFYFPITKLLLGLMMLSSGERIYYLSEKNVQTPAGRPIIYANTHKFKPDIERISFSLNKPSVMVASDFRNSYKTISGWYFGTRPTIFVDPYSKTDKKYTYDMMVRYLQEGCNCMIFPEAVWNLSPNKIVLDIFSGTVRAALDSNAVIVCTAIERYGKNYVINRNGFIDLTAILKKYTDKPWSEINNDPTYAELRKQIITECNSILRDRLGTLMFEIWEAYANEYGLAKREDFYPGYWEEQVQRLTQEWPGYKLSDNVEQQVQNPNEIERQEITRDIEGLRGNLNIDNLFMFTDYIRYERARQLIESYESGDRPKVKTIGPKK